MKKKDIYIQEDQSTCGASCIQSVVSHFGGYVPLETVKSDTQTDKNGTDAYQMIRALKKYGIKSYGMKLSLENFQNVSLPVIAHTVDRGYEHFVVVYECRKNSEEVVTMNPECGKKIYHKEDFTKIFDEKIIVLLKEGEIPKYKKSTTLLKVMFEMLKKNRKKIIISFLLNLIVIVLTIFTSLHLKLLNYKMDPLSITYIFILLKFITYLLEMIKLKREEDILHAIDVDINATILEHIFSLPQRYLNNHRVGELIKKIEGSSFFKTLFTRIIMINIVDLLSIICCVILMFYINPKITTLHIFFLIIYLTLTPIYEKNLIKKNKKNIELHEQHNGYLVEDLEGIESIKNLNEEERFLKNLQGSFITLSKNSRQVNFLNGSKVIFKNFICDIEMLITSLLGFLLQSETFTYIDLMMMISLFSLVYQNFESIIYSYSSYLRGKLLLRSISEFLDLETDKEGFTLVDPFEKLLVKNLTFSYDNYNYKIRDLTLEIKKGEKYLLTGPSGAGKSTFVKCMIKRFDNYLGEIFLNGKEIKTISPNSLKNYISYIGQEEKLFSRTIKENIVSGDLDLNLLEKTIKTAELEEVIKSHQSGIDTALLEGATNFSGGEKARIYLARALYKNPSILIIDETLSAIGEELEDKIIRKLLDNKDLTLIYITHRNKEKLFKNQIIFRKDGLYEIK